MDNTGDYTSNESGVFMRQLSIQHGISNKIRIFAREIRFGETAQIRADEHDTDLHAWTIHTTLRVLTNLEPCGSLVQQGQLPGFERVMTMTTLCEAKESHVAGGKGLYGRHSYHRH